MSDNALPFIFDSKRTRRNLRERLTDLATQGPNLVKPQRDKKTKVVGVWNLGQTCYMSAGVHFSRCFTHFRCSVLRTLVSCPYVCEMVTQQDMLRLLGLQSNCVFRRFAELVFQSRDQVEPLDPFFLKKRFTKSKGTMIGYGQQDSFEYFLHLIDAIDNDISVSISEMTSLVSLAVHFRNCPS